MVKEWHSTKNGELSLDNIKISSNKRIWWRCKIGHEWQLSIYSMTHR
ncbi:MAG: zinc-ribbon domain-containing protein [Candidatus Niameybacter stercoravium]|nr:zinc-ribbon domain-containing protein [Candidatus Niameybacter stercoravium]